MFKKNLAFTKYILKKNSISIYFKNVFFFNKIIFFLQQFGFFLITNSVNTYRIVKLTFNNYNASFNMVLFLKKSNKIILSSKGLKLLSSKAPSLFLLVSRNNKNLINHKHLIMNNKGCNLRGFIS